MTMASGAREDLRDIRPLQFRELLDAPYALVRSGGWSMLLIMAAAAATTVWASSWIDSGGDRWDSVVWVVVVAVLVSIPFRMLTAGVLTLTAAAAVTGRPITWSQPWMLLRSNVVQLAGVRLLIMAAQLLALLALAITCVGSVVAPAGAAFVGANQILAQPVLLLEGSGARAASRRSAALVGNLRMRCVGLLLTQWAVLAFLVLAGCVGPPLVAASFYPDWVGIVTLSVLIAVLLQFCTAVMACVRVTAYFDIRCRREGLDLIMRAAQ
ncbi:hypothetical protein [Williamsia sp. CHRR-6]|uniref:hypothetical protein n=1 Tax=Williamsia sp. CHRR-6 TaxID=2835871 RepID=UPI001BDA22B6|nr:hypothetical protein [Williamsia sp. CHRR-6]MBT0565736.1 hypothetical protein [Williamsia sp. CHRR-6]